MTPAALLALLLNVSTPLMPGVMVCALDPPFPPHCNLWIVSTWPAHQKIKSDMPEAIRKAYE